MAGLSQVNLKRDYTLDNTKKLEKGKKYEKNNYYNYYFNFYFDT